MIQCAKAMSSVRSGGNTIRLLAVGVVVGQQQLHRGPAGLGRLLGGDADLHPLAYRVDAGCHQSLGAAGLYQTDAAGTGGALTVVEGAQRGDLVAALLGSLHNGDAVLYLVGEAFDLNIDFCHDDISLP